jgi:tetratricopeptide (TPR) repeat protein
MRKVSLIVHLVFFLLAQTAFALSVGKVTRAKGSVSFRSSGTASYKPVASGQEVREGNWVKTGKDGWVELTLSDNSRFTIANNSELEINTFAIGRKKREGTFNLVQGKLRASVVKLAGRQTDIKVKSGTAVAGVKGTEFLMLSQGPANVFFGNEGTVAVSGSAGESEALPPDTMTQNTRGYRPVAAVKVEPATPLAKAKSAFEQATGTVPPAEWADSDNLPNIIARWDINHGHYLADAGLYDEALHVFQIALDLTTLPDIRSDARLERAAVYGRFLKHPEAALAEYLLVLEEYPKIPQIETALYSVGQTLYDMGQNDLAKARFTQYLKEYPEGRYRSSVETLLRSLER